MAELLVRVVDKRGTNLYLDCQCTKRGDVIVAQPDGWPWGKEEVSNPDWRIIKIPGAAPESFASLLQPELAPDPRNPPRTLQRRWYHLDLDDPSLDEALKVYVSDGSRQSASIVVSRVKGGTAGESIVEDLLALTKQRPSIPDPAVIGDDPPEWVIG